MLSRGRPSKVSWNTVSGTLWIMLLALLLTVAGLCSVSVAAAKPSALTLTASDFRILPNQLQSGSVVALYGSGHASVPLRFAQAGRYLVTARAWGSQAFGQWPLAGVAIDGVTSLDTTSIASAAPRQYRFTVRISRGGVTALGLAFLNNASSASEDRNLYFDRVTVRPLDGAPTPRRANYSAWRKALGAREADVLANSDASIERVRKGTFTVVVVDAAGRPVPDARITSDLTRHDFRFGGRIKFERLSAPGDQSYADHFTRLFNAGTLGFWWANTSLPDGTPNYNYFDSVLAWAAGRGVDVKAHALLSTLPSGARPGSTTQPSVTAMQARVSDLVGRYAGRVATWEVANEPLDAAWLPLADSQRWAKAAAASSELIVNQNSVFRTGSPRFYKILAGMQRDGVPWDGVGLQCYEPGDATYLSLTQVKDVLARYAGFGKPIDITELEVPSSGKPIIGGPRKGIWDEKAQAWYVERLYRTLFADPAVHGITWWGLSDRESWLPGGGLLRADGTPKPAYDVLDKLINTTWHTQVSGATTSDGAYSFRGFYGTYQVTVTVNGVEQQYTVHLGKGDPRSVTLQLSAG